MMINHVERCRLPGQAPRRKITSEAVKPVSFHTQPLEPEGDVLPVPCPKEPEKHITTFEGGDASPEIKSNLLKTQETHFL